MLLNNCCAEKITKTDQFLKKGYLKNAEMWTFWTRLIDQLTGFKSTFSKMRIQRAIKNYSLKNITF